MKRLDTFEVQEVNGGIAPIIAAVLWAVAATGKVAGSTSVVTYAAGSVGFAAATYTLAESLHEKNIKN